MSATQQDIQNLQKQMVDNLNNLQANQTNNFNNLQTNQTNNFNNLQSNQNELQNQIDINKDILRAHETLLYKNASDINNLQNEVTNNKDDIEKLDQDLTNTSVNQEAIDTRVTALENESYVNSVKGRSAWFPDGEDNSLPYPQSEHNFVNYGEELPQWLSSGARENNPEGGRYTAKSSFGPSLSFENFDMMKPFKYAKVPGSAADISSHVSGPAELDERYLYTVTSGGRKQEQSIEGRPGILANYGGVNLIFTTAPWMWNATTDKQYLVKMDRFSGEFVQVVDLTDDAVLGEPWYYVSQPNSAEPVQGKATWIAQQFLIHGDHLYVALGPHIGGAGSLIAKFLRADLSLVWKKDLRDDPRFVDPMWHHGYPLKQGISSIQMGKDRMLVVTTKAPAVYTATPWVEGISPFGTDPKAVAERIGWPEAHVAMKLNPTFYPGTNPSVLGLLDADDQATMDSRDFAWQIQTGPKILTKGDTLPEQSFEERENEIIIMSNLRLANSHGMTRGDDGLPILYEDAPCIFRDKATTTEYEAKAVDAGTYTVPIHIKVAGKVEVLTGQVTFPPDFTFMEGWYPTELTTSQQIAFNQENANEVIEQPNPDNVTHDAFGVGIDLASTIYVHSDTIAKMPVEKTLRREMINSKLGTHDSHHLNYYGGGMYADMCFDNDLSTFYAGTASNWVTVRNDVLKVRKAYYDLINNETSNLPLMREYFQSQNPAVYLVSPSMPSGNTDRWTMMDLVRFVQYYAIGAAGEVQDDDDKESVVRYNLAKQEFESLMSLTRDTVKFCDRNNRNLWGAVAAIDVATGKLKHAFRPLASEARDHGATMGNYLQTMWGQEGLNVDVLSVIRVDDRLFVSGKIYNAMIKFDDMHELNDGTCEDGLHQADVDGSKHIVKKYMNGIGQCLATFKTQSKAVVVTPGLVPTTTNYVVQKIRGNMNEVDLASLSGINEDSIKEALALPNAFASGNKDQVYLTVPKTSNSDASNYDDYIRLPVGNNYVQIKNMEGEIVRSIWPHHSAVARDEDNSGISVQGDLAITSISDGSVGYLVALDVARAVAKDESGSFVNNDMDCYKLLKMPMTSARLGTIVADNTILAYHGCRNSFTGYDVSVQRYIGIYTLGGM